MVRVYVFELAGERWPVVWQGRQPPRDSRRCTWRLVARVSGRAEADRLVAELYGALRSSRRARRQPHADAPRFRKRPASTCRW